MMSKLTLDDLRRQALANGEELVINGRVFNAERATTPIVRAPKVAPKDEAKSAPPPITADDITRLLAERDAMWQAQQQRVTDAFTKAIDALPKPTPESPPATRWVCIPSYGDEHDLERIVLTPEYD